MTDTTDELLKIEHSLEPAERAKFLGYVADHWPRLAGAHVADVLDHTTSYDMFLDRTEPWHESYAGQFADGLPLTAVLHTLIILGRELTVVNVTKVLMKAGLMPQREAAAKRAYDPLPDLAALLCAAMRQGLPATGAPANRLAEGLGLPTLPRPDEAERAIREALRPFITPFGRWLMTPAELDALADEAERGYDFSGLRPLPGHDRPGHTAAGPQDCRLCRLLRENAHWMALPGTEDPEGT